MSLRDLDFADGIFPSVSPTEGTLLASALQVYASDAAFVTAKGSAAANGDIYINSTDNTIHHYVGGSWRVELLTDAPQVITNKDIDGGTASNSLRLTVPKNTTSNLNALTRKAGTIVYDTTLNLLKYDNGTVLSEIGGGGGGSGSLIQVVDFYVGDEDSTTPPAYEAVFAMSGTFPLRTFRFSGDGERIYCILPVPMDYVGGTQIFIRGGFGRNQTSAVANIQATVTIARTSVNAYVGTHSSATVTLAGSSTVEELSAAIDLTDSSGQVGGNAVALGDYLLVYLTVTASSSTTTGNVIDLVRGSFYADFGA